MFTLSKDSFNLMQISNTAAAVYLQCVYSNLTGPMYIDWNTHTSNFFTNIRLLYQNLNLYLGF